MYEWSAAFIEVHDPHGMSTGALSGNARGYEVLALTPCSCPCSSSVCVGVPPQQRVVQITEDYLWHCLWFTQPCNPANQDLNPSQGRFDIFDLAKKVGCCRDRDARHACRHDLQRAVPVAATASPQTR